MLGSRRSRIERQSVGRLRAEAKYVKQTGGRGQYGHVWLRVEPAESGKGSGVYK